jgi:probable phosphoglycerate mutase
MKTLFLVRHGQTDWNIQGRFQGRCDVPLNPTGIRQTERAAQALARIHIDAVWSSPLSRATQTARIIAEPHRLSVDVLEDLTEICHGTWEGLKSDAVASRWPELLDRWHRKPEGVKMPGPGGESLGDVKERSVRALAQITDQTSEAAIVVAHDAVLKTMLCHLLDMPLSSFWRFRLENGSISVFDFSGGDPVLCVCGDGCHLGNGYVGSVQLGL